MQLKKIHSIEGKIKLLTGLHIGSGDAEMHIGGTDNPVIRHPITRRPYIPGSSLKGKMRSLMEWRSGAVQPAPLGFRDYQNVPPAQRDAVAVILKLFGVSGGEKLSEDQARNIGPTRLAFWDCELNEAWVKPLEDRNQSLTEIKSENQIDRIRGVAKHPRSTERVPAGAEFCFRLSLKVLGDENLLPHVLVGLRLIELDSLGGSGSRGYGKVAFQNLTCDGQPITLPADPFAPVA